MHNYADGKIVVAFSGGLDTTYCAAWLKETTKGQIITATVDTGGFSKDEIKSIEERSKKAGADLHLTIDGKEAVFEKVVKFLIAGNVLRGNVYPLCVSAERLIQAELIVDAAKRQGATIIAHGSTGAGNDQVRFDVAIRTLAPHVKIIAPIREQAPSRVDQTEWLAKRNIVIPPKTTKYSINAGLWGTTIGGGETHNSWEAVPDDAYPTVVAPRNAPKEGVELIIRFEKGVPVAIGEEKMDGVKLITGLNKLGAANAVGRGVHIGDTILGIKGRVAFEAPAAVILLATHRELEKITLTRWQQFWKDKLADFYGVSIHEALFYDPVVKDIEALISSSQSHVTGDVRINLCQGVLDVVGVRSLYSMMDASKAKYGEEQTLWNGRDAEGFAKIYGLQGRLAREAEKI